MNVLEENRNLCFRLDIGDSLLKYIQNAVDSSLDIGNLAFTRQISKFRLIQAGRIGVLNDVVVDDVNNPKVVYGFCNGDGGFIAKEELSQEHAKIMSRM